MGGRSAVGVALAAWIGLLAGAAHPACSFTGLALVLACAPLALGRWNRIGTLALLGVALGAGLARGAAAERRLARATPPVPTVAAPEAVWIRARVVTHPAREGGEPMAIAALVAPCDFMPAGSRVRLLLPADCPAEWGDTLLALARLEPPLPLRVPGGLSGRDAARSDAVCALGRVLAARVSAPRGLASWPRATFVRWRRGIETVFAIHLSPQARELVTPLVTGDRSAVSPWLTAELQDAGLTHLLALSGLHVAWLASVARVMAAALGGGLAVRALAGAACAIAYAGIAGPLPSLMRAVANELLFAGARLVGRPLDPVQSLAVTALVLLGIAPGWASDLGFQLSCAATAGLVTIGHALDARGSRHPRWLRGLLAALVPTLAAQATALPLLLARFHALPWTTLGANLAAVPVSGMLLSAAWLGAALEALAPGGGALPLAACEWLAAALRAVTACFAGLPLPLVPSGHEPGLPWLAGAGAALLAWACAGPRALAARRYGAPVARTLAAGAGALALALALVLVATVRPLRPPPDRWWLVVLDVGQGDALALGFADGWWLVDAGPRTEHQDAGRRVVLPFLRWVGARGLDALLVTHDDSDHTGGAPAVRAAMPVARMLGPVALPRIAGPAARLRARGVAAGDTLRTDPAIHVVWPERGFDAHADNAAGLVLVVGEGRARALLTADVDSTIETRLLPAIAGDSTPRLEVLKTGHHGAASSTGMALLAHTRPRLALVSCGRHNAFGHPAPVTLERLAWAAAVVRRTDREGTLWVELSEAGARVLDWRSGEPRTGAGSDGAWRSNGCRAASPGPVARPQPRW